MTDIDRLLEQARAKSKDYGRLYGAQATADDYLKSTYASLYGDAVGSSIPEKDSWIKRHPDYLAAIERKQNSYADWKTAETYMKLLFAEAEVWRTKSANDRKMDNAHR
jgi:hypothetical protein